MEASEAAASNYGTFAPKNFRSRERKYHGMELSLIAPRNFRSLELSLPGAKVPRTFAPSNVRSLELSLPGTKVPRTFASTPSDFRSFIGADSMGAITPTARKLWGQRPLVAPTGILMPCFETAKCSVTL